MGYSGLTDSEVVVKGAVCHGRACIVNHAYISWKIGSHTAA